MAGKGYIYTLREKGCDEVKYVGRAIEPKSRFVQHVHSASLDSKNEKERWIAAVMRSGGEIEINIIETCDLEQIKERERYWISFYKTSGHKITNGNNGHSGIASRQLCVTRSKAMMPIIKEARLAFPDAANDAQALTLALLQWYEDESLRGDHDL